MTPLPSVKGPTWARSPLVTVPFLGVQIVWSTEMAFASPYLLSLGLSRAVMALVFAAGPLSGLVVQPLIGVLADTSTSRFGRRAPFMLGGCLASALGMLLLGFTRQFSSIFTTNPSHANDVLTAALAVFALYVVDFSINAVMAVDRALIVDILSEAEQQEANAWTSRMVAVGAVFGFFVGQLDLAAYFPSIASTQLQFLSIVTGVVLLATHLIAIFTVKEVPLASKPSKVGKPSAFSQSVRTTIASFSHLPPGMLRICMIQFVSMLGWFPIMFFTTVWIGDVFRKQYPEITSPDEATRAGTVALFYSAIVSLVTSNVLPFFILPLGPEGSVKQGKLAKYGNHITRKLPFKLDLPALWAIALMLFGGLMWSTYFVTTVQSATWIFALTGFPSTCCHWAPYTILGEIILSADPHSSEDRSALLMTEPSDSRVPLLSSSGDLETEHASQDDTSDDEEKSSEVTEKGADVPRAHERAGSLLAIVNIFIVLPQFVIIGLSSVIFAIFDPGRSVFHKPSRSTDSMGADGGAGSGANNAHPVDAVGLIFRIGGTSAFVASYMTWRLTCELRRRFGRGREGS